MCLFDDDNESALTRKRPPLRLLLECRNNDVEILIRLQSTR